MLDLVLAFIPIQYPHLRKRVNPTHGGLVAEHLGGPLPLVADVTERVDWEQPTAIAISVEDAAGALTIPRGPRR
jgi:hypothetical protein